MMRLPRPRVSPSAAKHPSAGASSRPHGINLAALGLVSLPARAAEGLVWIYQKLVSPALAVAAPSCGCRFAPTCSHYAREALREHGLIVGLALAFRRLAKCAPWHPGGLDPVPPSRRRPVCARVTSA